MTSEQTARVGAHVEALATPTRKELQEAIRINMRIMQGYYGDISMREARVAAERARIADCEKRIEEAEQAAKDAPAKIERTVELVEKQQAQLALLVEEKTIERETESQKQERLLTIIGKGGPEALEAIKELREMIR